MENVAIDNKNKINSYQAKPTLFYDIQGTLVENRGKDIRVEKTIDNKTIEYSLRLKEEIQGKIGEKLKVEKENILDVKIEEKEEELEEEQEVKNVGNILRKLGLEYSEENIRMLEHLISSGISLSKENVDSYIKSKEYLRSIIEEIDPSSLVKLANRGIDLEGENLQNISEALEVIKSEKTPFSIKRFLKLERDLTYKEAEEISKEIYNQKMGKDVYDTIIALDKENLPITKENINRTTEAMAKLYGLKDLESETYIKILAGEEVFNIDNLFKIKNDYTISNLESSSRAEVFEHFTIEEEATIDSLKEMLLDLNIENTGESISILREFIVNNMTMDEENYNKIINMKEDLGELRELLNHEKMAQLINQGIDPEKEDIHELVDILKVETPIREAIDEENTKIILETLESLGQIQDKDLLQLIKQGEDFNLKSIKEIINTNIEKELTIEYKTLDRTDHITNILQVLGEDLNREVISLANRRYDKITLNNLYESHKGLEEVQESIKAVDEIREGLIFEEYLKTRNNLRTNLIKESIREGKEIETMALAEVNKYMEKKINKYKEVQKITREIGDIKGNEDRILPIIMKNNLPMTLKEIKAINQFFNGEKGISQTLKSMGDINNKSYTDEFKEEIQLLQEKLSKSLKNSDEGIKKDYKDLIKLMENPTNSSGEKGKEEKGSDEGKDYSRVKRKISNKDIILQIPVEGDKGYKDLNIIIPYTGKEIDKNNMSFAISLETENLGLVMMDLKVSGKEVGISLREDGDLLEKNIEILQKGLKKLGYSINLKEKDL